ncbi:MAG: OmpA family protein [Chitinivibrionales bacterium]|nr:OmpA family protein [Chitinivibrionales bacterium]
MVRMLMKSVLVGCMIFGTASANLNSKGQKGVMRTVSGKTFGKSKMNVGAGMNYAQGLSSSPFIRWDQVPSSESGFSQGDEENGKFISSNAYLAMGVASFWDVAVSIPFMWDGSDLYEDLSAFGIGDLEFSTKLLYPRPDEPRVFYQAYFVSVAVGVSQMMDNGIYSRHGYYKSKSYSEDNKEHVAGTDSDIMTATSFVVKAMLCWTFDIGTAVENLPLEIIVNGGIAIPDGSRAISGLANLALAYTPVDVLTIYVDYAAEVRGNTVLNRPGELLGEPMWLSPGIRVTAPVGVYVQLGADIGLSSDSDEYRTTWVLEDGDYKYSTPPAPKLGVQFAFGWSGFLAAQDDDRDGIKNKDDRCPKDAEDIDGFEDSDGCPDEDNDKDGIADKDDKCPNEAEDKDGFKDEDGCPDSDNDEDGIVDIKDKCPLVAEDFDGFEDKDGCPDYDNDKDGVPDSLDKCPNDVEDFDKFKDDDGCPDIDNDKDGIPDLKDKCPNEPENFNNVNDKDGCPDEKKKESKMPKHQVIKGVKFKSGRSEMSFDSYRHLDPIIEEMKKYPEIEIEIRGHTDSIGRASANKRLSQMRAESVRQYLISRGIESHRMRAVGFGSSSPIADNRTAAGRAQNRRIEIVRIK